MESKLKEAAVAAREARLAAKLAEKAGDAANERRVFEKTLAHRLAKDAKKAKRKTETDAWKLDCRRKRIRQCGERIAFWESLAALVEAADYEKLKLILVEKAARALRELEGIPGWNLGEETPCR